MKEVRTMQTIIEAIADELESSGYVAQQHPNKGSYRYQRRLISIHATGRSQAHWNIVDLAAAQKGDGTVASGTINCLPTQSVDLLDSNEICVVSGDAFDVAKKLCSIAGTLVP
jgi:hypothetical protein